MRVFSNQLRRIRLLFISDMKNNYKKNIRPASVPLGPQQMNLNLLTLSFPQKWKKPSLITISRKILALVRFGLLTCFVFFSVLGILDAIQLPEMKKTLWVIRYAFICPYLMFLFVLSYSKYFKRSCSRQWLWQWSGADSASLP